MTFSVIARCANTGAFGIAITSSSPAVASRCAYVRAGVGVAATQNITDPRLGPALLEAMAGGLGAPSAMAEVSAAATHSQYRQLSAVDAEGLAAVFGGSSSLGINGEAVGEGCVAAGNLLATLEVLPACLDAFAADAGLELEERLVRSLEAGLAIGGEAGPVHSAGLLVARDVEWPVTNLRVDWSETPISDLRTLWTLWAPQRDDYITRALNPAVAPRYGVPGDDT